MTTNADELIASLSRGRTYAAMRSAQHPECLRVAPDVELALLRSPGRPGGWSYDRFELEQPWARNPRILGMRMIIDPRLPRGVWRILASDDTLLHDPREGMTLRQIRETYK